MASGPVKKGVVAEVRTSVAPKPAAKKAPKNSRPDALVAAFQGRYETADKLAAVPPEARSPRLESQRGAKERSPCGGDQDPPRIPAGVVGREAASRE